MDVKKSCRAVKKDGSRCKYPAWPDSDYCGVHYHLSGQDVSEKVFTLVDPGGKAVMETASLLPVEPAVEIPEPGDAWQQKTPLMVSPARKSFLGRLRQRIRGE